MNHYIPEHLKLHEVLPRDTYLILEGKREKAWRLFDPRILWTADQLRFLYGPIYVNDWFWGGNNQYGGWRPGDCDIGAEFSQHKFGRALDIKFKRAMAYNIRQDIKAGKWPVYFQYITCVENGVAWLHIDCRNYEGLLIVTP